MATIIVDTTYAGDIRCEMTWDGGYEMYDDFTGQYYGKIYEDLEEMDEDEQNDVVSDAVRNYIEFEELKDQF